MKDVHQEEHRDLAKGAIVNLAGIAARSTRAIYLILIPRLFGTELFGLYLLVVSIVEVASKISTIGLDWATLRWVARLKAQDKEEEIQPTVFRILRAQFAVSLCCSFLFLLATPYVARNLFQKEALLHPLLWMALFIPFIGMQMTLLYGIRSGRKMQYEVYVKSIWEPAILLICGILASMFYRKIEGLLIAYMVSSFGSFLMARFFFYRVFHDSSKSKGHSSLKWGELFHYSLPMSGMDVLNIFKQRLDVMVIGRFLPLQSVGVFGAIVEIGNLIKKVRNIFEPVFMPIVTYLHEKNLKDQLVEHFGLAVRWIITLSLSLLAPMLFAPDLFLGVFSPDFVVGSNALRIISFGMIFYVTFGLAENVLSMTGHPYINFICSILLVGMNLGLHLILIPRFGIEGAALATASSFIVNSFIRTLFAFHYLNLHPFRRNQMKPLYAWSVAFTIAFVVRQLGHANHYWTVLVVVPIFYTIYWLMLRKLGFEAEDRDVLRRLRRRVVRFIPGLRKPTA